MCNQGEQRERGRERLTLGIFNEPIPRRVPPTKLFSNKGFFKLGFLEPSFPRKRYFSKRGFHEDYPKRVLCLLLEHHVFLGVASYGSNSFLFLCLEIEPNHLYKTKTIATHGIVSSLVQVPEKLCNLLVWPKKHNQITKPQPTMKYVN